MDPPRRREPASRNAAGGRPQRRESAGKAGAGWPSPRPLSPVVLANGGEERELRPSQACALGDPCQALRPISITESRLR